MAIIVEGFDNSGKSTLAASFGLEIAHPGPRPVTEEQALHCLLDQLRKAHLPIVMDRVTAISQPCYGRRWPLPVEEDFIAQMLTRTHCVLIYCRPPIEVIKDFSRHIAKSYDEEHKIRWLHDHAEEIVGHYDLLMSTLPHMRYDYTNPDHNVTRVAHEAQYTIGDWARCKTLMTSV